MIRSIAAIATLAVLAAGAAPAQTAPENVLRDIASGSACKVTLRVTEIRTPFVPGMALGTVPDDVYLEHVAVKDKKNPLCRQIMAARQITLQGTGGPGLL